MKRVVTSAFFAVSVFATATATVSAAPEWSGVAAGCVPSEDTIAAANWNQGSALVEFAGSDTGDIHLICPVNIPDGTTISSFEYYYGNSDADSAFDDYYAQVVLRMVEAGNVVDICSKGSTQSGNPVLSQSCTFTPYAVDTDNEQYLFYVRLHRTGTAFNPRVYQIRLF